jgi:hypothetical protein
MMQLTQYEYVDHASVAVHQCDGAPIDVTYARLFEQVSRLPDGQLVAIFEDDLFLVPYSAQWFDFCAEQFKSGAHKQLFSCSFWNDECFGQKKPVALRRYVRSQGFSGLGWMLRVDERIREFTASLVEQVNSPRRHKPWDAQMSDWFLSRSLMSIVPEMSRVRHVPHRGAKHLNLLKQSFMSTTENVVSVKSIRDAVDECDMNDARRIESFDQFVDYFKRERADEQAGAIVIGGYPRQYYEGVYVHFDGADEVHCVHVDKAVFEKRVESPSREKARRARDADEDSDSDEESQTSLIGRRRRYLRRTRRRHES